MAAKSVQQLDKLNDEREENQTKKDIFGFVENERPQHDDIFADLNEKDSDDEENSGD